MDALKARGPEGSRLVTLSCGQLGFTRLAINGLTDNGMQPMQSDDVHWITNGEIYNWKKLCTEYELVCTSGSDCEVIGEIYKHYFGNNDGALVPLSKLGEMFRSFDGVFATIIVDESLGRIIVARDPYGVRPLFKGTSTYYIGNSVFFGSELKSLSPECTSIETFEPGTFEVYDSTTFELIHHERYHFLSRIKLPVFSMVESASLAIRSALESAVKKRMMTERRCGALLSGGLDSSLIASLVSKQLRLAGAPPLKTFSIGMKGSSDLAHAKMVAKWIGSEHTEIVMTADEFFEAIPAVIYDIESYDTTTVRASVGNWLVAREAAKSDCKVIFNGDGADEVFGSYLYMYKAPSERVYEDEVMDLLKNIHTFDVLRSDRSISSHGLEPRTPFLDKTFVQTVLNVPIEYRRPMEGCSTKPLPETQDCLKDNPSLKLMATKPLPEKWLLRRAFDDGVTLPREVLWRRKEAFSDGVSGDRSWYEIAQEKAIKRVGSKWEDYKNGSQLINGINYYEFTANPPMTAEMFYYRILFESSYPAFSLTTVPRFWMPKWSLSTDPSARTLANYLS